MHRSQTRNGFPENLCEGVLYGKNQSSVRWFSKVQDGCFKGNAEMSLPAWPWPLGSDFAGAVDGEMNVSIHLRALIRHVQYFSGQIRFVLNYGFLVCRLVGT